MLVYHGVAITVIVITVYLFALFVIIDAYFFSIIMVIQYLCRTLTLLVTSGSAEFFFTPPFGVPFRSGWRG